MYYNLEWVYDQARSDEYSVNLNGDGFNAVILYGCKIVKDNITNEVRIYNLTMGGDHYQQIDTEYLENFVERGWRYGVYVLYLSNCRRKLVGLESAIKNALTENIKAKTLKHYKSQRTKLLSNYSKIKLKLNQLNEQES